MKKLSALLLAIFLVLPAIFCANADASAVSVYVDGALVEFDVQPQIINDRTMVPLRAIFEELGATVIWDDSTKTATSQKGDIVVSITIGDYKIIKNGEEITIDVPAQIVDSRTLVPVRAISESFECKVEWDDATRSVIVVSANIPELSETESDMIKLLTIGGTDFSAAYLKFAFKQLEDSEETLTPAEAETKAIEYLKNIAVFESLYKDLGVELSANDILDIKNLRTMTIKMYGDASSYQNELDAYGMTDTVYLELLKQNVLFSKLASAFVASINVSDVDIFNCAQEHYIRAKHILVKDADTASSVLEELKLGASFEDLVKKYSSDGMDVDTGYYFTYGMMVEPFETAAFALAVDEVSDIVKTDFGYHIIKRYLIESEHILSNKTLVDDITAIIYNQAFDKAVAEKLSSLTVEYAENYEQFKNEILAK